MIARPRNEMLDAMRFAAIAGVVALHYPFEPNGLSEAIRVGARWSVPFFFLLTGCFLPAQSGFVAITAERLQRFTTVAVVASLLYLPLALATQGLSSLGPGILVDGTWFHLWFLNALVIGFLLLLVAPGLLRRVIVVDILSIAIVALYFLFDVLNSYSRAWSGDTLIFREISGFAFMWLGFRLAGTRPLTVPTALAIVAFGVVLLIVETLISRSQGISMFQRQLPLGAVPIAAGLILFGISFQKAPAWIAQIGRNLVLPIYILHPLFLKMSGLLLAHVTVVRPVLPYLVVLTGLLLSTLAAAALMRFWPSAGRLLNGITPPHPSRRIGTDSLRAS